MNIMKIKLGIPSIGEAGEYIYTSFLYRTTNKPLMRQFYEKSLANFWFGENEPTPENSVGKKWHDWDKKWYRKPDSKAAEQRGQVGWWTKKYLWKSKNIDKFGEHKFQLPRVTGIGQGHKEDPMLFNASKTIEKKFFPPNKKDYSDLTEDTNFRSIITFKYSDGECNIMLRKRGTSYSLDNIAMQKKDAVKALTKILLRSVYTRSCSVLDEYIERVCDTPHNVLHCLENRSPYYFYDEGRRQDVLINTKMIGYQECALEISENIWASIKVKDLNQFLNFYRENKSRGKKWPNVTPEEMWKLLFHEEPSSGQSKLMRAWLLQNRTSKMVEDRATGLLRSFDAEYPNLHYMKWPDKEHDALYVQGKVRDWIITGKGGMKSTSGHQKVDSYCVEGFVDDKIQVSSRICIDNLHNNSSVGDQISARALLLMNDEGAGPMVHTIRHHVQLGVAQRDEGKPKPAASQSWIDKRHYTKVKA